MMRKRRHNQGDILIDLTSLLDVVFIILLVVICNQQKITSEVQTQQAEAAELSERADVQLQLYQDQMNMMDNLCLVSVNARYESENVTVRHVYIQKKGEELEEIDFIGKQTAESLQKIKSSLEEYIQSHPGNPVILSLNENDEKILYRDEKAIQTIFNDLKRDFENVYIK